VLGGSSSINAMVYVRGHPSDYDGWAALGNAGWSFEEVLPYFKRAEHNERGADALHGQGGPLNVMDLRSPNPFVRHFIEAGRQAGHPVNLDFNGVQQEGVGAFQVTHRNGERWSAAKAYLTPHLNRPNLQVFTDALSTRVLSVSRDGRASAVGVEYRPQGGRGPLQSLRLNPGGEVLLSAGSFGSPQLLMLSGIGPPEHLREQGLRVTQPLPGVGQNLQDHPDVVMVMEAASTELFGLSLAGLKNIVAGMGQWRRGRSGMLTSNFAEAGGFLKSSPEQSVPDLQLHFVVAKLVDHGRKTVLGHGYSCHVCLLRPQSRGCVRLSRPDPQVKPLIDPGFLSDPDDLARLVRGFRLMRALLHQPALKRQGGRESQASAQAQTDGEIEQFIRNHADTVYHPVGTCRMGPDAATGAVVDARLRVHGVDALRVVDASVMPTLIGGNTNAPVIMVAEKAVDMIRQDRASLA
jgi:choline dehydrogenase-like flavoprotein